MILNFNILALQNLVPDCEYTWVGSEWSGLEWLDSRPKPSEQDWEAEKDRLIAYHPKQNCKDKAKELIALTDWSQLPDRSPMIKNLQDFISYRDKLLELILNPVENPVFPDEPQPIWE